MSSKPAAADLLAAVEQSPALVAVHDRRRWCDLYATDGEINDPVGSRPHQGRAAIERFYDTFIKPNTIVFKVEHNIVCGMSVVRDLAIETTMPTGVTLTVPMHLRYDLVEEAGALKIRRLYAHWELPFMIAQLLATGWRGIWTSIRLGPQLIANQGFRGLMGFMRGFLGVGAGGKRRVKGLLDAFSRGNAVAAAEYLETSATLELPVGQPLALIEFAGGMRGLRWRKLIVAGRMVTATIEYGVGHNARRGVALFEFARRRISRVQIFVQDGATAF